MGRWCALVLLIGLAVGCSDDDPVAVPETPAPTSTSASSTPAPTSTSTTSSTASTTNEIGPARLDDGWQVLTESYGSEPVLLSAGEGERVPLRYRATGDTTVSYRIRDRYNDSLWTRRNSFLVRDEVVLDASVAPLDDGLWMEVRAAGLGRDVTTEPVVALHFHDDGVRTLVPHGASGEVRGNAYGIAATVSTAALPLPAEPVGVGARWRLDGTYPTSAPGALYELTAIDGDLITVHLSGVNTAYDGDRYGGSVLEIEQSGVVRIDLSSAAVAGVVRAEGTVHKVEGATAEPITGSEEPFWRETVVGFPAAYRLGDERPHTITIDIEESRGGDSVAARLAYDGDVEMTAAGAARFSGSVRVEPDELSFPSSFDLLVEEDGAPDHDEQYEWSLAELYAWPLPRIPSEWIFDPTAPLVLTSELPLHGGPCIGGCNQEVTWSVTETEGSRITITTRREVAYEYTQRGARTILRGTYTGDFTIDLFDPFAVEGSYGFDGEGQLGEDGLYPIHERVRVTSSVG